MIKIDVAKAGAQLFNLSNLFNARVNDGFTPVKVQWVNSTDSNKPLDVKAMKAFLKGQIGQGTIKDDHVELEPKSDLVSWEDDGSGSQLNGITLIKLPPQVFTRDGVFYGYIGLEDANGTTITSINIWFNVDQNVITAGANVPYYLDEIQAALSAVQRSNDTLQRAKQEIDNQISLSKAAFEPEGFENETALKAKYPAGASGLMVTVDTGHKWLWIKGAWVDCGIYQAAGLADGVVHTRHTDFATHQVGIFKEKDALVGIYNVVSNTIVYQGANVDKHYGDFTCFKFKADPNERTYTVSGTDFNVFGSTEDGTLAWSDNQSDGVTGPYAFTVPNNVVWVYVSFLTAKYDKFHCFTGSIKFDEAGRFLLDAPLASPISDGIVKPETTTFIEGHSNLFGASNSMNGIYNIANGKIVFQNASVNKHYGDFTCFKFKADPNERTYTVSGTDFNVFGSTEDGTLAWSDNQSDGVTGPYTFTVPDNVVWVYVTFLTKRINGYKAVVGRDLGQVGYRLSDKIEVPNKGALQVHVGKDYQYERLIDAVNSINPDKDNVYTIYLHDTSNDYTGTTFDLLEELGGTNYLATIENAKDNMQGFHLPPYVNLVGVGKITLLAELPDGVSLAQSTNFSTIELEEGNNRLEGLTIRIRNGRYAVHDESRDKYPNAYHIFKNVRFVHEGNLQGLWDVQDAYAAGTSAGCTYSFTNCIFDVSKSNGYPFSMHNYAPQLGSTVTFDGIKLISNANRPVSLRFGFNGYSPVTDDPNKYEACYTDVYIKNVIGNGEILVESETDKYNCTNSYRLYNFTNLKENVKNNQIK